MTSRPLPEPVDLEQYLSGFSGKTVYYCPNPGNAGDSLIALATFQMFRRLGVPFVLPSPDAFDARGRVVIYGGGGNLVPPYTDARQFIARHHQAAERLIVLPHTIAGNEDLLSALGRNVTIICREPVSYAHTRQFARGCDVLLGEDLGLHLDVSDALRSSLSFGRSIVEKAGTKLLGAPARSKVSPKYFVRDWWQLASLRVSRLASSSSVLNAFRTDAERRGPVPDRNTDLSQLFEYGVETEQLAAYCTRRLLSVIRRFQEVHTNRLHVTIAAALLGKSVQLHANSYFKCRAVYEFSLAKRFPNVRWMHEDSQVLQTA